MLIVTNDFPPRQGGIQSMIFELAQRLPPARIAVYTSDFQGADDFDRQLSYPVTRHPTGLLVPTPAARKRVQAAARAHHATTVWFGAAAPLGLLAPALAKVGVRHFVATTHGHEVGWARLPVARQALRRIGSHVDVVTYLAEYTRSRLASALGSHPSLRQLTPGVDTTVFTPDADGRQVRTRYGLDDRPVIVCVSRLVRRKGQDSLISALASIRARVRAHLGAGPQSDVALLLVGAGPYLAELRSAARQHGVSEHVVMTGAVESSELAAHYAAGDVFAMPCRTRRYGLDVEGLGIVYLEASACGLPVVAGRSGGAPDAVLDGETGFVIDGTDQASIVDRVAGLLIDRTAAQTMGRAGRRWVQSNWQWDAIAQQLAELLQL